MGELTKILCLALVSAGLCGCMHTGKTSGHAMYKPIKIAPFLYEIYCDDYVQNLTNPDAGKELKCGCSSVRNGNFHGRNLDLYYNHMPEFVVHMKAGQNRYASLSVCAKPSISDADVDTGLSRKVLADIPNMVIDGINEKGVTVNVNVVPAEDVARLTGTNPGKPKMYAGAALRVVLDRAASAREAIAILDEYDISGGFAGTYNLHYMISDKTETIVGEFIDNKLKWVNANIMTNYYNTLKPTISPHGQGLERYKLLLKHYDEGASLEGMAGLMKRVRYSNAYLLSNTPVWYSEFYGLKGADDKELTRDSKLDDFTPARQRLYNSYLKRDRNTPNSKNIWITVSSSVYDIENKVLRLVVQENYEDVFMFKL